MHSDEADSFVTCCLLQCQVSFLQDSDDAAQSEAAEFIVSMSALMMSDPFCRLFFEND